MIRLITNLNELNLFSLYDYTIVNKDAKCDIAVIQDNFSIVKKIHETSPNALIIFISTHYHYLNEALSYNVFAYLLKPVDELTLQQQLCRLMLTYCKRNKKCIIHTYDKKIIISSHDLIYFSSSYKEIKIVTKQGTYYTHINNKKTMLDLIDTLDFIHVSKSLYINKNEIISSGHNSLLLSNGEKYFLSL